jgi:FKBP-type peptidyl-prolyl cis-trans isomerase FklB
MAKSSKKANWIKSLSEKNLKTGAAFLAENALRPEVKANISGLQYEIIEAGTGSIPQIRSQVLCHYKGYLLDGTVFDDSYKRGNPEAFFVYELIAGWIEALTAMPVGSKWKLYVPPHIGYGPEPVTPESGGNCTLIFEMELLSII